MRGKHEQTDKMFLGRWVLALVLVLGMAGFVPAGLLAQAGQVQLEGNVEVFYEDYATGGIVRYFLNSNGGRYELRFGSDSPGLQTGERVRARGVAQPDGTLQLSSGSSVTALTTTQTAALGPQATIVILVNFLSNPVQPYSVSQAQNVMSQTSNHFWQGSYGQTTVVADVKGWYTVDYTSTNCDSSKIASLADQAATNNGVDLTQYRRRVYAFPSLNT